MQKVKLTFKTPVAVIKDGKPAIEYKTETSSHIVASTKSYNNLVDEMKQNGKIATESNVSDLFLDKANAVKAVAAFVASEIEDKETADFVTNHIIKALDGACVFKKPPVIRAKSK